MVGVTLKTLKTVTTMLYNRTKSGCGNGLCFHPKSWRGNEGDYRAMSPAAVKKRKVESSTHNQQFV